ncbi:unnamed protein product, partial [Phaeothamnion confervicola]
ASASSSAPPQDILSMLVAIYGSKEVFVTEYRLMLAERLLENVALDTNRERLTLEELKLRFGEESMKHCDIMLRDVDASKRINANVRELIASEESELIHARQNAVVTHARAVADVAARRI